MFRTETTYGFDKLLKVRPAAVGNQACIVQMFPVCDRPSVLSLNDRDLTLGRNPDCQVMLRDESASRVHATIRREGQQHLLTDERSTNGTYVNDILVDRCVLQDNDFFVCGASVFRFLACRSADELDERIRYLQCTRDPLTQSFSMPYLFEHGDREMIRFRRNGRPMSLIVCRPYYDSDDSADISFRLNQCFCGRLRSMLRREAVVARDPDWNLYSVLSPESDTVGTSSIAFRIEQFTADRDFQTVHGPERLKLRVAAAAAPFPEAVSMKRLYRLLAFRFEKHMKNNPSGRQPLILSGMELMNGSGGLDDRPETAEDGPPHIRPLSSDTRTPADLESETSVPEHGVLSYRPS